MGKSNNQLWSQIVDLLSLKQYKTTMGGDMTFKSKAERAMKASRSKQVHDLCKQIIRNYEAKLINPDRKNAISRLEYSRQVNDPVGVMVAFAQLSSESEDNGGAQ